MWRHVFEPNERDHAFAVLGTRAGHRSSARRSIAGASMPVRITARRSRSDPTAHGTRSGSIRSTARVARSTDSCRPAGRATCRSFPAGATHADLAVAGRNVAVAWKRFDGSVTKIESLISNDAGRSVRARAVAADGGRLGSAASRERGRAHSGRLAQRGRHRGEAISRAPPPRFEDQAVRSRHAGGDRARSMRAATFWLVLWDLECSYCMKSLKHLAAAQRNDPQLKVVTIATDPIEQRGRDRSAARATRREVGGVCVRRCAARSVAVRNRSDVARREAARVSLRRRR